MLLLVINGVLGISMGGFNKLWQQWRTAQHSMLELQKQRPGEEDHALQSARQQFEKIDKQFTGVKRRKTMHFMLGVVASLVTLLVNSITVTYFVGTSRWCREVVETYQLDMALAARSAALKRKSFPWAVAGILAILSLVVLGSLADPAANPTTSANWVSTHYIVAILATCLIGWAFLVQVGNIGANFEAIGEILDEVRRVRSERGLDVEETPAG